MEQYRKDNLPMPVEEMPLHRKTALTPMVPVEGPVSFVTQEGEYELPEGWKGYCAVDKEGYPYPVSDENYNSSYEREGDDVKAVGFPEQNSQYARQFALDYAVRIESLEAKDSTKNVFDTANKVAKFIETGNIDD